jgi:hypothetical protein
MPLLNPGDPFPGLTISTDGQALTIPDAFAGDLGVVLFYRGQPQMISDGHSAIGECGVSSVRS